MLRDRYDSLNLLDLVPQLSLTMEPELAQLDHLLEDDALFRLVRADLARRHPHTETRGRPSTPVEVILRMLVIKRLYGFSYEETEYFVSDSLVLRQFCRLALQPAPDDTTLLRWANLIGPQTVERINDRVVALARELKVTRGRKLRVDTTLVETPIHHPTDGALLGDGVRVLSRLLGRARAVVGTLPALGKAAFRSHTRSVRPLIRALHRLARRQSEATKAAGKARKRDGTAKAARTAPKRDLAPSGTPATPRPGKRTKSAEEAMKETYQRLIGVAKKSLAQAQRVSARLREEAGKGAQRLAQQFEEMVPRVEQVIQQAWRRVIGGEVVAAKEKLVSLFEPHTQIVKRGKSGRPVEFGRKVILDEVESGIVTRYAVLEEAGPDEPYLKESLAGHQERFGKAPDLVAADRGFSSPANEQMAKDAGVKRVVIPYAGKAPPERVKHERQRWFRRGYRFRAGIEGRISVLKRRYGLDRCRDHGEEGLGRWVGWGIVASNLAQIAATQAARQTS
jgi:transposase, IS5 family